MSYVRRLTAFVVPFAVVLSSTGTAFAGKTLSTPPPSVTAEPAKSTSSTTATFGWTTAATTTYTCSLDGATFAACASPKTYTALAKNRSHTFSLKAKRSGSYRATTWSYGWTIDTVPPVAPTVGSVGSPTSKTTASVTFADADTSVASYRCALDGAAATACTSPKLVTGLAEGTHALVVSALDAAGNAASASRSWVVDLTPPLAPAVTQPVSPTVSTSVSVPFSDADSSAVAFTCQLDASAAAACASPFVAGGLAEGTHSLTVTASDVAGNGAGTVRSWVVDLTPPAVPTLVSGPAAHTQSTSATVVFGDADNSAVSYTCSLDSAVATVCGTTWSATGLLPGVHSLAVRAFDSVGNGSAAATLASWTVDPSASAPVITGGPAFRSANKTPTFAFIAADPTLCSVDGATAVSCTSPYTTASLLDGAHTFTVVADHGGTLSDPATYAWTVDTVGPSTAPLGGPAPASVVTTSPTFTFTTADVDVAGFLCSVDNGAFATCASPFTPVLPDGAHTLSVATVDQAGNQGRSIGYAWTLDTVAPKGVLTLPTASLTAPAKVTFSEDVVGASAGSVQLRLAGSATAVASRLVCLAWTGAPVTCTGLARAVVLVPVSRLVPGQKYVVAVTAALHDPAGNPAVVPTTVFRALRAIQESGLAMAQAWAVRTSTAAYGGRYVQAELPGASVAYAFRGTAVTWYTATGPAMGTARVYVDGRYVSTVNGYASSAHWRVPRAVSGLASAAHVLRVVATGQKGSRYGVGAVVVVDAVRVGSTTVTNPALVARWATVATAAASGGRYAVADQGGSVVTMTFRGTSITWLAVLGRSMGLARVYVDGVLRGTYDGYSSATRYGVRRTWALTDKVHTITILVLGTHRAAATGARVAVDALLVG